MRILLFLVTNLAVLVLVSIIFNLLGFDSILAANGVDLNLQALLVFCALFGFGGAFVSLFLSKWMAKKIDAHSAHHTTHRPSKSLVA
jgi:heat shock protein HtpX